MAAADRAVQLQQDAYDLLVKEAALDALAEFRAGLPPADAVAVLREGRAELEARHA
jgi:hypothetical protein